MIKMASAQQLRLQPREHGTPPPPARLWVAGVVHWIVVLSTVTASWTVDAALRKSSRVFDDRTQQISKRPTRTQTNQNNLASWKRGGTLQTSRHGVTDHGKQTSHQIFCSSHMRSCWAIVHAAHGKAAKKARKHVTVSKASTSKWKIITSHIAKIVKATSHRRPAARPWHVSSVPTATSPSQLATRQAPLQLFRQREWHPLENVCNLLSCGTIVIGEQGDSSALRSSSPRTPVSVHVVLFLHRRVKIDDVLNCFDVQASSRDVSRDKHAPLILHENRNNEPETNNTPSQTDTKHSHFGQEVSRTNLTRAPRVRRHGRKCAEKRSMLSTPDPSTGKRWPTEKNMANA